jgi:hypothetical protein
MTAAAAAAAARNQFNRERDNFVLQNLLQNNRVSMDDCQCMDVSF